MRALQEWYPDPDRADPQEHYRDLTQHMAQAELVDLWATDGIGPGPTCTFTKPSDLPPDPDEPDRVLDPGPEDDSIGERLDYLWLYRPRGLDVTVERPRRWSFGGRGFTGGPAGSLSDHLALSVTVHVRA